MDGNGRISRLLTVLLLYKSGYDIVKYISFEGQINKYKDSYFEALRMSSDKWHENENDYVPFIVNFLQVLYKCFKDLDESFTDISLKKAKKSERVKSILMGAIVPVSKQDIIAKLPDVSGYRKGKKAPETTNVKIDFFLENLDLSELKGKATYEQIKDYVREQTGFRVSSLYISQVKRKCGLEVGESYNKPKSDDARQPQCTPEKEEAIMQALSYFGVI